MNKGLPCAIYLRKSTESGDRQAKSLGAQLYDLKLYAKTNNLNIVQTIEEERSAKKPFNRPKFTQLLKDIEKGTIQAIAVWESSRISRNPSESGMVQQLLIDGKLKEIHTMTRVFRPEDNTLVFGVESAFSAQYSIELRHRAIRGYRTKVRSGQLSGRAPEGYINNFHNQTIEKDPLRFPLIRKAFDMYMLGHTVPEIHLMLNESGYLTIKRRLVGGQPIAKSTLYKMLSNPRYAGIIPDPDNPGDMTKAFKAQYPAMITTEEFDRIQNRLAKTGRTRYVSKKEFDLKGLFKCGECGCSITAERKEKKLKSGLINYHTYYHCTWKRPCSQKAVKEEELIKQVYELLGQYELSTPLYEWALSAIEDIAKQEMMEREDIADVQEGTIASLRAKLDRLIDLAADGIITAEEYSNKSKGVKTKLELLQSQSQKNEQNTQKWHEVIGRALEALHESSKRFVSQTSMRKRDIILSIGENPVIYDKRIRVNPFPWLMAIHEKSF